MHSRLSWWPFILRVLRVVATAALILATAVVGGCFGTAWAAPEDRGSDNAAVNRYGGCLASQKAGDLLILVDESGSLKHTDAGAARVDAAKYLVKALGGYADRTQSKLDVAIAGFAEDYNTRQDWTPLNDASVDSVNAQVQALTEQNSGADTDYWLALDGARQSLTEHARGNGGRCQAIAWFSDGKLDFAQHPGSRPYASDVDLNSEAGTAEMARRARESICKPGGVADQLRSEKIVLLGVGLGDAGASSEFDVMSAITTGSGPSGNRCGSITEPTPGSFYRVSNIDQMLFAFDALNPTPGVDDRKPVCHRTVCQEARHNFVLDGSVQSVNILGSGGMPGVVPYLISPSGQQLQLPKKDDRFDASIDGMPVSYEWQSESAQTISLRGANSPRWPGQWAIVYVDTTGKHPDAVSRVAIHITTDIFPALKQESNSSWRAGQVAKGVGFGLVDGRDKPIDPASLAGDAELSVVVTGDGAAPVKVFDAVPKNEITEPVDIDLSNVRPGPATVRMSLVVTTAPPPGGPNQGTRLSPQQVDKSVRILPKLGLPAPGDGIDFGTVQGAKGAAGTLDIEGPGCVWIAGGDQPTVTAAPDGIGVVDVASKANGTGNCVNVEDGQQASLPVTLRTDHDGHGGLNGTVPVHIAPRDGGTPDTVDVAFTASLVNALSTTNFVLVFLAALVLGPGIPLALLYVAKWYFNKIPDTPMLADRIPVEVDAGVVLRDGAPFEMADTDLVTPVPGLTGGARTVTVQGVGLSTVTGRSPFGPGQVKVHAPGYFSAGSEMPSTDETGVAALLPLAVHGTWILLLDQHAAPGHAEVVVMTAGQSDLTQRQQLYQDIERRLPEMLSALRRRASEAGLAGGTDGADGETESSSPFGFAPVPGTAEDPFDPFKGDT